jgi:hypothetical protein
MKKTVVKFILIYSIGVIIGWFVSFKIIDDTKFHDKITYGDIGAITLLSLTSWIIVFAGGMYFIYEADFWNKPIESNIIKQKIMTQDKIDSFMNSWKVIDTINISGVRCGSPSNK